MAPKHGNKLEIVRRGIEDKIINRIDKGENPDPYVAGDINRSIFERLKVKQPAIAWRLGKMAGWEMTG